MTNATPNFIDWLLLQKPEYHFLSVLASPITHLTKKIVEKIKSLPAISKWVDWTSLYHAIYNDILKTWSPKLLKVGIVEMHQLKSQQAFKAETSEARFKEYILMLNDPAISKQFFEKYTVLDQQWRQYELYYSESLIEMFSRLNQEANPICHAFFSSAKHIQLIEFKRVGDLHQQGRAVTLLHFRVDHENRKIVYKPRPLQVDLAFYKLLEWVNTKTLFLFKIPFILAREHFGFYEFIEFSHCENEAAISRYYYRLGGFLALFYSLLGTDMHGENIIASGEHPVFIDLECLLSLHKTHYYSVLDSWILPQQAFISSECNGIDLSAFGAQAEQAIPELSLEAHRAGFDDMCLTKKQQKLKPFLNQAYLQNQKIEPLHFSDAFFKGFEDLSTILLTNHAFVRKTFLADFETVFTRYVPRKTYEYAKLLHESYHPSLLLNFKNYQKHFSWLQGQNPNSTEKLFPHEVADLLEANIPFFKKKSSDSVIVDSRSQATNLSFEKSSYENLLNHWENQVNSESFFIQKTLIEASFNAYALNRKIPYRTHQEAKSPHITQPIHTLLKTLQKNIIVHGNDRMLPSMRYVIDKTWMPKIEKSWDLYNGLSGAGLVLAYAAYLFQDQAYYHAFLDIAFSLSNALDKTIFSAEKNMGFFNGIGGLIYTAGVWQKLFPDALSLYLLERMLFQYELLLAQDSHEIDVTAGLMGGLASLLSLENHSILSEKISRCAKKTIDLFFEYYPHPDQLPKIALSLSSKVPLTGYSHGASGIIAVLWQYAKRIHRQDERVTRWIDEALTYEKNAYSACHNNWADFRARIEASKNTYQSYSWCHGAPGILLSRLQLYQHQYPAEKIFPDINNSLDATLQKASLQGFNLCHGGLGILDILFSAMQNGFLEEERYRLIEKQVLAPLKKSEPFYTLEGAYAWQSSLMTGHTGVIYQLLRLFAPHIVPSLLSLGDKKSLTKKSLSTRLPIWQGDKRVEH